MINRKNILGLMIILMHFFSMVCISAAKDHDLVIFHTNDVHGYAFAETDGKSKLSRIGYDRLKTIVDSEKSERKLLLDAGDVLHGQSFAAVPRGELISLVLSMIGYDALAVGNHDFDYGQERLKHLIKKYRLNFLAANIFLSGKNDELFLPAYLVKDFGDMKVGIFGLSTPETVTSTDSRNIIGLKFNDPVLSARDMVKRLKSEGVDLIVALTHMGSEAYCKPMSQTIASEVPGIDIIIDGHSHSKAAIKIKNLEKKEVLIVSTGSYFNNLGRINVDRLKKGGYKFQSQIIPASEFSNTVPDASIREAIGALKTELDKELTETVMTMPFELDGSRENVRKTSTNLGRIICASLVEATGADAAILNGGSIRDSIPAGKVAKGELLSVLPYGNYIYLIEITGRDLISVLNYGLSIPGSGAFPQFWGMKVIAANTAQTGTGTSSRNGLTVESVQIRGQEIKENAKYVLAINDFMYSGGDGYKMFSGYKYKEFATLEEVFRDFVTKKASKELLNISDTDNLIVRND
jgi:2',3'-cyclic-nucleotide 2'-phosphodiesterase (5'-nucleotidase family)